MSLAEPNGDGEARAVRDLLSRVDERSLEAMQAVGHLLGEVSRNGKAIARTEEKVDALILDVRKLSTTLRDSVRPRLESFHDKEEEITEVTRYIAGEKRASHVRAKAVRRVAMAAILGAAGAVGAVVGVGALRDCGGHAAKVVTPGAP